MVEAAEVPKERAGEPTVNALDAENALMRLPPACRR